MNIDNPVDAEPLDDESNKRAVDLVEFITRMDSIIARVEFLPPSTLRDRVLKGLLEARAAGDAYFGGTKVMAGRMMGDMA